MELNDFDKRIIAYLKRNGPRPVGKIRIDHGMSAGAFYDKMKELERHGYVRLVIDLDGFHLWETVS